MANIINISKQKETKGNRTTQGILKAEFILPSKVICDLYKIKRGTGKPDPLLTSYLNLFNESKSYLLNFWKEMILGSISNILRPEICQPVYDCHIHNLIALCFKYAGYSFSVNIVVGL